MKKNIKVRESELIDRLNESVGRWDNHGPVQFEEDIDTAEGPDKAVTTVYKDGEIVEQYEGNEAWKNDYFDGKTVNPMEVSLSVRDDKGNIVDGAEKFDSDYEDNTPVNTDREEDDIDRLMYRIYGVKDNAEKKDAHLRTLNPYEEVNHPQHYNNYDVEVITMMERIFGKEETAIFCKLNAFKYRMRAGTKPGQDTIKDLQKEKWYLDKKKELEG